MQRNQHPLSVFQFKLFHMRLYTAPRVRQFFHSHCGISVKNKEEQGDVLCLKWLQVLHFLFFFIMEIGFDCRCAQYFRSSSFYVTSLQLTDSYQIFGLQFSTIKKYQKMCNLLSFVMDEQLKIENWTKSSDNYSKLVTVFNIVTNKASLWSFAHFFFLQSTAAATTAGLHCRPTDSTAYGCLA